MKHLHPFCLFVALISGQIGFAQSTPFSATWHFEGDLGGSSSTPLVAANTATLSNVLVPNVGGFPAGQVGKTANIQNWTDPACPGNEYLEITVSPAAANVTMVLSSLTFYFSRSAQGPNSIKVKHSLDGFSTDLYTSSITATGTPYQSASIDLTAANSAFMSQTQAVSFRFYGCNRNAINGSLRLDEITINATALPVTLVSFTAKSEGNRVQLSWSTTAEHEADYFRVERSQDLGEFVTVGEVKAHGTTSEPQYYGVTDKNPLPGINYYRLRQVDQSGTVHTFRLVSAIIDLTEPVVTVFPNPAVGGLIHLRLWNADDASCRLLNVLGQSIGGRLERQPGEADWIPDQPLPTGLYYIEIKTREKVFITRVIVP